MRVQPSLPALWREGLKASANGVNASGKSSDSAHPGDDGRDPPRQTRQERTRLEVELVCQEGTKRHDPFWDGPRLKPTFVTQLLGQMMTGADVRGPGPRVYGTSQAGTALLLDTRF